MKMLLEKMRVKREEVKDWGKSAHPVAALELFSEAMRPAALTETWRELRGKMR